jgi:hypothetical protein
MRPLLLHSLAEFEDIIFPTLELAGARSVVEVGSEEGTFTRVLADWAEQHDGRVFCIEPEPTPALLELCAMRPSVQLVKDRSLGALEEMEPADAYLIDGDHNYYTVAHELEAIDRRAREQGASWLAMLHDVGWPSGRRDMYYAPDTLPPDTVHPHTWEQGVLVGESEPVDGGFRGEGSFAWARHEGGPANGVLTAVEDFLAERDDLAFVRVPCVFGLGVIYPAAADYAPELSEFLRWYDQNRMLDRLEQNRLALYLALIELQDQHRETANELEHTALRNRDLSVENRALWARTHELEAELERVRRHRELLHTELGHVAKSRAFSLAERLSRLRRSGRPLSRERLQQALDADQ